MDFCVFRAPNGSVSVHNYSQFSEIAEFFASTAASPYNSCCADSIHFAGCELESMVANLVSGKWTFCGPNMNTFVQSRHFALTSPRINIFS